MIIIEDDTVQPTDDDDFIDIGQPDTPQSTDDTGDDVIIVDDDSGQEEDDEYFDLDGF